MYLYSIYLDCDLRYAEFEEKGDAEQRSACFREVDLRREFKVKKRYQFLRDD